MKLYAVIMAGGRGERFWPFSRAKLPKQLLHIFGEKTLLEEAVERLNGIIPPEHILVLTNRDYESAICKLFPQIPAENIIAEPCRRDTAPCVALAAGVLKARNPSEEFVIATFSADPIIHDTPSFQKDVEKCAFIAAESKKIVVVGVAPTFPSTDYGYIECGDILACEAYQVKRFREKPAQEVAYEFVKSGNFLWNCGIFFWRSDVIASELSKDENLHDLYESVINSACKGELRKELPTLFSNCRSISIDYAVMEKSSNILACKADFDWDDAGSWASLSRHLNLDENGNVVRGNSIELFDCKDCVTVSSQDNKHLIAVAGCDDLVVVHCDDATLVMPKGASIKLKGLLQKIRSDYPGMDVL